MASTPPSPLDSAVAGLPGAGGPVASTPPSPLESAVAGSPDVGSPVSSAPPSSPKSDVGARTGATVLEGLGSLPESSGEQVAALSVHTEEPTHANGDEIVIEEDDWTQTKTLRQLRDMCTERGLSTNGKKVELVQRLQEDEHGQ